MWPLLDASTFDTSWPGSRKEMLVAEEKGRGIYNLKFGLPEIPQNMVISPTLDYRAAISRKFSKSKRWYLEKCVSDTL